MNADNKNNNLINKAKDGNCEAFSSLYEDNYIIIKKIILSLVKDEDVAEDLCSITFIKMYEKINTYVNDISFIAWLKTIAVNTVIDYVRANKNRINNVSTDDLQIPTENEDPEVSIIKKQSLNNIKESLKYLKVKYKDILLLRYYDELSYKEIADKLKVPIGTVKSELNKAKKKLKETFNKLN